MLAKNSELKIGAKNIELPLLIPAYTSKGFAFKKNKGKSYSEITSALQNLSSYATDSVLISAYDIHFKHFDDKDYPIENIYGYLSDNQLIFLDSGGYELMKTYDSSEIISSPYKPKSNFKIEDYKNILLYLSKKQRDKNWVIANFDYYSKGIPIQTQIEAAYELFDKFPMFANDFIIKPLSKNSSTLEVDKISSSDFKDMNSFDIIGVSEKDLGNDVIKRAKNIAKLRNHLNEAGVEKPLHIWGGLDPLITPIYFFAGAQIFDGASWLRYAFINGVAMNRQSFIILNNEVFPNKNSYDILRANNIKQMRELRESLRWWTIADIESRYDFFHNTIKESLIRTYKRLKTTINYI